MAEWFADETFWADTYAFMFPDERLEAAGEQVEKILGLAEFKGHTVLDLACGPGRHSVAMARKGLGVTGVDLSEFLLAKARARASESGAAVEWIQGDMRDFVREDAFDLALSMFTSFGFFDDREDDLKVLSNVFRSLRAEGVFIIDVIGKEHLAHIFESAGCHELEDGAVLFERREVIDDWTRIRNEWVLVKGSEARSYPFTLSIYSGLELKDRLTQAGFRTVRLFGDLDGHEYGPKSQRLIAVARK